ncbi:hypothetical protein Tco_0895088 [Tanacetum coccineum]|uniref:Reverse transcriptase domain-containing protein n=1 Tax=Tanacetum coccineum TaxID=301880 RepID=A0ABQ5CDM4_9ASTR
MNESFLRHAAWIGGKLIQFMHTTMVPVLSIKTLEDPSLEYQFSRKGNSENLQLLEDFTCVVFVHDRNIVRKDPGSFTLPCFINDFCFDNVLVDLGASADRTMKYLKGIAENVLVGIGKFTFPIDFIIFDMPEDVKVPLIFGRPFLSTAHAKIDVYKRKITLRVGEENIIFKCVKPASTIIKRVYMLSLRERMELDLEVRLMGETLVLNRSLDPFSEDYIEYK